jgi:hypothetical protein
VPAELSSADRKDAKLALRRGSLGRAEDWGSAPIGSLIPWTMIGFTVSRQTDTHSYGTQPFRSDKRNCIERKINPGSRRFYTPPKALLLHQFLIQFPTMILKKDSSKIDINTMLIDICAENFR